MFGRVVKHDHRKLVDLRERLFRIETGQKRMSWKRYQSLKNKTDEMEEFWLKIWAGMNGIPLEEQRESHRESQEVERMEALLQRHFKLHPGDKEMEAFAATMNSAKRNNRVIDPELFDRFMQKLNYLYANCPQPPKPSGLFKRFFGS